jgi:hypothetical protein
VFFPPPRPVQEFSLAELVAKITELTQRQRQARGEVDPREPKGRENYVEGEDDFGQELTE